MNINRVILAGNLTRDPDVRYLPSGTPVTSFRLAVNRRFKGKSGDVDETCFIDVKVYGKQAESCGEFLSKGRNVLVEGYLRLEQWDSEGGKRSKHVVVADRVQFLGFVKEKKEEEVVAPDVSDVPVEDDDEDFPF
ncbi:MAG TPA: single-stranded DNA-binding protein [Thermosulfidibacter takaii]|uniref:Single-stranded DNA-binding protein n=1 Tax=Thermosulfidibacter takaii TaxID=412593 RepID=A0A7C0U5K8_9BACT|nr:single-stranded DNA-binding protein [Thermosulfidibacter takaii]